MKYKEAIVTKNKKHWKQTVKEEQERMISKKVCTPIKLDTVHKRAKILTSTWAEEETQWHI